MKNIDSEVKKRKRDNVKYRKPDLTKAIAIAKSIKKHRKKKKNGK
jgi:hypothetical protein